MKIPRKEELLRLQELYKTDARIAEALGGIPEYLVAYWRRKKGIPRHSAAKFSRQQITELWERLGDDFRCGRELNISKAAFYSWRRKYGISEKPAVLKLEQLELRLDRELIPEPTTRSPEPRTASDKIRKRCRETWPSADVPADWVIAPQSEERGAPVTVSPGPALRQPLDKPAFNPAESMPHTITEATWCYPEHGSVLWQLVDARVIPPGQLVRGPRCLLGGMGGIGTLALESTDSDGEKRVIKIEVTRRLPTHADVEDLFLALLSHQWNADWANAIVEFWGGPIERLTIDRKVKLCALTTQFGAAAALCPFDDVTRRYFGRLIQGKFPQTHPDRTALYDGEHFLEGRSVEPRLGRCGPGPTIEITKPAAEPIGGVIIGPDALPFEIERAAELASHGVVGDGRSLLVLPATTEVFQLAQRRGWAQTIRGAGGSVLDVNLIRRLGDADLIALAAGPKRRPVVVTNPWPDGVAVATAEIVLAGVWTAVRYGLGFRSPPQD